MGGNAALRGRSPLSLGKIGNPGENETMCVFKKIGVGALLTVLGLGIAYKTGLNSYAGTAWHKVKQCAKQEVPLEFEIERVRHEVAQLVPEMKKHLSSIAEEMVAVESLRDEIAVTRTNLERQKDNILTMRKDLETGAAALVYDGRTYSAERVRTKLSRDFDSFKTAKTTLESREALLEAREKALEAAREQLTSMKAQKQELEVRVAQLEAQLKTVRVAQTRNKFQIDDSHLSRCKEALAEIESRLKIESRTSELQGEFANDAIPVEKKAKSAVQLSKEIDGYFGEPARVAGKD
jgi:chromosome segregation ATPase